jgi:hypothetical protein
VYALTGLVLVYYVYKLYKCFNGKKKADSKSEIDHINELYRGLNSEDSLLQQQIEKHLNLIITFKQT